MSILEILKYPDPLLKEKCEEVTQFDAHLAELLDDMFETMYAADGVGLAAPQIGIAKRITVIDVTPDGSGKMEFVNPEIIATEGSTTYEEGCLSIPGFREYVKRAEEVKVRAFNRSGEEFEVEADELFAICLQHEIDHLDGVLFIDHLSPMKKQIFRRWFKKREPLE